MPKQERLKQDLHDLVCERVILSAILQHGTEVIFDIDAKIKPEYFHGKGNRLLYSVLKDLILTEQIKVPEPTAILAKVNSLDKAAVETYSYTEYLSALNEQKISIKSLKPFLDRFIRLGLSNNLKLKLKEAIENIESISGNENVLSIISMAEKPIADFTESLISDEETVNLTDEMDGYLEGLASGELQIPVISTGYPVFDKYLGRGLRAPGIHILAGRPKAGKSFGLLNIAARVSAKGIPVLILDTELTKEITLGRLLSLISGVQIERIESSEFLKNPQELNIIRDTSKKIKDKNIPIYYRNISGQSYEEWISLARRWLMKVVGFNDDGSAKPCLIVLDYIKTMDIDHFGNKNTVEHQYLGQLVTDLHNFCVKYNVAVLSGVQVNREGISREDLGVIAGSDRISQLASTISLIKTKNPEELADADNGESAGTRKLMVLATRFGPGIADGEYINVDVDYSRSRVSIRNTNSDNRQGKMEIDSNDSIEFG